MLFVEKFKKGKWLDKSNSMLADKSKVLSVLTILARYMKKGGLKKIREQLRLLYEYITDIIHGKYKAYSGPSLTLALAAILYVISPLDILPDLIPFGFVDDIAIVTWAMTKMEIELQKYQAGKSVVKKKTSEEEGPNDDKPKEIEFEEVK